VHEISIALSLIQLVEEQLMIRPDGETVSVTALTVEVGSLSGVVPAALRSAFGAAVEGTRLQQARLDIQVSDGRELDLISLELTEPHPGCE
jgi:hydrogenase nickel incorporation protein HypA/HybF